MGSCCSCCEDDGSEYERLPFFERPKVESVQQDLPGAPTRKKWYHAKISDNEAEWRLKVGSGDHNGSYLVYDNPRRRGQYVLLVIHKRQFYRWMITYRKSDKMYVLGDGRNPSVRGYAKVKELVKAHRGVSGKPLKTDEGASLTLSRSYVYPA